jgi:hypothetical protein
VDSVVNSGVAVVDEALWTSLSHALAPEEVAVMGQAYEFVVSDTVISVNPDEARFYPRNDPEQTRRLVYFGSSGREYVREMNLVIENLDDLDVMHDYVFEDPNAALFYELMMIPPPPCEFDSESLNSDGCGGGSIPPNDPVPPISTSSCSRPDASFDCKDYTFNDRTVYYQGDSRFLAGDYQVRYRVWNQRMRQFSITRGILGNFFIEYALAGSQAQVRLMGSGDSFFGLNQTDSPGALLESQFRQSVDVWGGVTEPCGAYRQCEVRASATSYGGVSARVTRWAGHEATSKHTLRIGGTIVLAPTLH